MPDTKNPTVKHFIFNKIHVEIVWKFLFTFLSLSLKIECSFHSLKQAKVPMSSGKGIRTEKGRCFPFFEALENCRTGALLPDLECREFFDDYMECLHHKKEVSDKCLN